MITYIELDGDYVRAIGYSSIAPAGCVEVSGDFQLGVAPSGHHVFNWTTQTWEDLQTIDSAKAARSLLVNSWRAKANQSYFTYLGKQIACDSLSRSDIDAVSSEMSLTDGFPAGWPGGWKCMDNTYVAITDKATWIEFLQAMTSQGTANFLHAQDLKAQIAAAITISEVEAIVW